VVPSNNVQCCAITGISVILTPHLSLFSDFSILYTDIGFASSHIVFKIYERWYSVC
jgi:hypothetical protein